MRKKGRFLAILLSAFLTINSFQPVVFAAETDNEEIVIDNNSSDENSESEGNIIISTDNVGDQSDDINDEDGIGDDEQNSNIVTKGNDKELEDNMDDQENNNELENNTDDQKNDDEIVIKRNASENNIVLEKNDSNNELEVGIESKIVESTLRFLGNGADGDVAPIVSNTPGEEIQLPANGFTLVGYTFTGWNTAEDGSGDTYNPNDIYTMPESSAEIDFYAQWKANGYTIKYIANGATSGSMNNSSCLYDVEFKLSKNAYLKSGYTFVGWNTQKDGTGTSYSNGQLVKNLRIYDKTVINLYAQWELKNYRIKYVNGKINTNNPTTYNVNTATIVLNDPVWKGHTFQGWYTDSGFTKKVTTINKGAAGDKTFYAKWTTNKYTIKFVTNGATSGSMKNMVCYYGKEYNLTKSAYNKDGYVFDGWNTKKDGSGTSYKDAETVTNLRINDGGVINLYAQWRTKKYTVKFNSNGGTGGMTAKTYDFGKTYNLPANTFQKNGCVFVGWTTNSAGTGKVYTNKQEIKDLLSKDGAVATFYAQWKPSKAGILSIKKINYYTNYIDISYRYVTGYEVYRSTNSTSGYKCIGSTTDPRYYDSSAVSGTTYYYKVRAYNVNKTGNRVYGAYSDAVSITTALKPNITAKHSYLNYSSRISSVYIKNNGSKAVYVGVPRNDVVLSSYIGGSEFLGQFYYSVNTVSSNSTESIIIITASEHYYSTSTVAFGITYDECEYIVAASFNGMFSISPYNK